MASLTDIVGPAVYLDTNILIYAVEDAFGLGARLRPLFERIDRGELRGVASELALAEVLIKPLRDGAGPLQSEYQQLLDPSGPLLTLPIDRATLTRAAELRAVLPALRLPDAIHAATALLHGCTTFLTNDARFETVGPLPVLLLSRLPTP